MALPNSEADAALTLRTTPPLSPPKDILSLKGTAEGWAPWRNGASAAVRPNRAAVANKLNRTRSLFLHFGHIDNPYPRSLRKVRLYVF